MNEKLRDEMYANYEEMMDSVRVSAMEDDDGSGGCGGMVGGDQQRPSATDEVETVRTGDPALKSSVVHSVHESSAASVLLLLPTAAVVSTSAAAASSPVKREQDRLLQFGAHRSYFARHVLNYQSIKQYADVDILGGCAPPGGGGGAVKPLSAHSQVLASCGSVVLTAILRSAMAGEAIVAVGSADVAAPQTRPLIVLPDFDSATLRGFLSFAYRGVARGSRAQCVALVSLLTTLGIDADATRLETTVAAAADDSEPNSFDDVTAFEPLQSTVPASVVVEVKREPTELQLQQQQRNAQQHSLEQQQHSDDLVPEKIVVVPDFAANIDGDNWSRQASKHSDVKSVERRNESKRSMLRSSMKLRRRYAGISDANLQERLRRLRLRRLKRNRRLLAMNKENQRQDDAGDDRAKRKASGDADALGGGDASADNSDDGDLSADAKPTSDGEGGADGNEDSTGGGKHQRGLVRPYLCEICKKQFSSSTTWQDHVNEHRGVTPYQCKYCDERFSLRRSYQRHTQKHRDGLPIKKVRKKRDIRVSNSLPGTKSTASEASQDKKPESRSPSETELRKSDTDGDHSMGNGDSLSGNESSNDDNATKQSSDANDLAANEELISNDVATSQTCGVCQQVFHGKREFAAHARTHDSNPTVNCKLCGKQLKKLCLRAHMKAHTGIKPHQCQVCQKRFLRARKLRDHMMIHTGEKPFHCTICYKSFNNSTTLKRHRVVHTGEKTFLCTLCGASFTQNSSLQLHLKSTAHNEGIKSYVCELCGKSFTQNQTLRDHLNVHNNVTPYMCQLCGDKFHHRSSFEAHLRKHKGIVQKRNTQKDGKPRVWRCDVCGKTFTGSSYLKIHSYIHSGEKPFSCGICAKTFTHRSVLRRHKFTHSDARPHVCSVCGKAFALKDFLTRHFQTHTGEHPFPCNYCSKRLASRRDLARHMKVHNAGVTSAALQQQQQQAVLVTAEAKECAEEKLY